MDKNLITSDQVKMAFDNVVTEELSKIPRHEFNRTQFRIEEVQESLGDLIKNFMKLQNTLPTPLKYSIGKKIDTISSNISLIEKEITAVKTKVKDYKKKLYTNPIS